MIDNKFRFMLSRSTTEAIFLLRRLMEIYCKKKKDLYMMFINLIVFRCLLCNVAFSCVGGLCVCMLQSIVQGSLIDEGEKRNSY